MGCKVINYGLNLNRVFVTHKKCLHLFNPEMLLIGFNIYATVFQEMTTSVLSSLMLEGTSGASPSFSAATLAAAAGLAGATATLSSSIPEGATSTPSFCTASYSKQSITFLGNRFLRLP
jgi:hypothetical protein